jgi:hypothetical protein
MNEQAAEVAASVLGEHVEAATRCEQVTRDMRLEAAGVSGVNRGILKGMRGMSRVMMPRTAGGLEKMETGGLPRSFVLAVTTGRVYAIEDKQKDGVLVAGRVVASWDREGFVAKLSPDGMNTMNGVPDDRQVIVLYLPLDGGRSRYMQAAARNVAAAGSPGMPHRVMVAKDDASRKVIDAIVSSGPTAANIIIGGQSLQDMMARAGANAAAADSVEQLSKLADLHERGVLSEGEFAAQKAKILGPS